MRISNAFPSNYLKAADLDGRNVRVLMDRVGMEDLGGDQKPILYFQGKERGLVLNKTNANNIAAAYGDDTDDWHGKEIVLYEAMVDFQGRSVAAIRVRAPTAKDRQQRPQRMAGEPAAPERTRDIGGDTWDRPANGKTATQRDVDDSDIPF